MSNEDGGVAAARLGQEAEKEVPCAGGVILKNARYCPKCGADATERCGAEVSTVYPRGREVVYLRDALSNLLERYVTLAGSGDCGDWDPETEDEVIAARAALSYLAPSPTQQK